MPSSGMVKFVSQKTCGLNVIEETPYGVSFFVRSNILQLKEKKRKNQLKGVDIITLREEFFITREL